MLIINIMPRKQNGGLLITVPDREGAFINFINNATLYSVSDEIVFRAVLNSDTQSPYANIGTSNIYNYGDKVNTLLIKLVFLRTIDDINDYKNEVNTQTDIFLKTVDYLEPLCPGIVYANIYTDKDELTTLFDTLYSKRGDAKTTKLLDYLYESVWPHNSSYKKIGLIAMEFAENYHTIYSLKHDELIDTYNTMVLYMEIKLAVDTGYIHKDLHAKNIMINNRINNYFTDYNGKPLIIDFGIVDKIQPDILSLIKQYYKDKNYVNILYLLCQIGKQYSEDTYGWTCPRVKPGQEINLTSRQLDDTDIAININISRLITSREDARQNMIKVFNDMHKRNPEKYPILPLTNIYKKNIYSGLTIR